MQEQIVVSTTHAVPEYLAAFILDWAGKPWDAYQCHAADLGMSDDELSIADSIAVRDEVREVEIKLSKLLTDDRFNGKDCDQWDYSVDMAFDTEEDAYGQQITRTGYEHWHGMIVDALYIQVFVTWGRRKS